MMDPVIDMHFHGSVRLCSLNTSVYLYLRLTDDKMCAHGSSTEFGDSAGRHDCGGHQGVLTVLPWMQLLPHTYRRAVAMSWR